MGKIEVGLWCGGWVAMLSLGGCESRVPAATQLVQQQLVQQDEAEHARPAADEGQRPETGARIVEDPGAQSPEPVARAIAVLQPLGKHRTTGTITFTSIGRGVKVEAAVDNLPKGAHAYHVHLYGDCSSADGKSAGPHFNFQGSSKNPPADIDRITGNLGDLVGTRGKAQAETIVETATLQGPYSLIGRSVVIHEQGNDPSQPPEGGAGGRIACGVIGIDQGR